MLIKEHKEGDLFVYQGNSYIIKKQVFRVNNIVDMDKQISVELVDSNAKRINANFWKSNYGKDPNIMYNQETKKYNIVEIKPGDTAEFVGFEYTYGGYNQFNPIGGYRLCDEKIEYNVLVDIDKCKRKIDKLVNLIQDESLKNCCNELLQKYYNTMIARPAAHSHHHAYPAGLVQHTAEVMAFAYSVAQNFTNVNIDYIVTASLFHDIMKIEEYDMNGNVMNYAKVIGHVVGSQLQFHDLSMKYNVDEKSRQEISHIILSHHGKKEWGSPMEPQTLEAVIVHLVDMISAKTNPIEISVSDTIQNDYYLKW